MASLLLYGPLFCLHAHARYMRTSRYMYMHGVCVRRNESVETRRGWHMHMQEQARAMT